MCFSIIFISMQSKLYFEISPCVVIRQSNHLFYYLFCITKQSRYCCYSTILKIKVFSSCKSFHLQKFYIYCMTFYFLALFHYSIYFFGIVVIFISIFLVKTIRINKVTCFIANMFLTSIIIKLNLLLHFLLAYSFLLFSTSNIHTASFSLITLQKVNNAVH